MSQVKLLMSINVQNRLQKILLYHYFLIALLKDFFSQKVDNFYFTKNCSKDVKIFCTKHCRKFCIYYKVGSVNYARINAEQIAGKVATTMLFSVFVTP